MRRAATATVTAAVHVTVAALLLLTACTDGGGPVPPDPGAPSGPVAATDDRPPLEEEQERLLRLRDRLSDRLSQDLQLAGWTEQDDRLRSGCSELPDPAAVRAFLPSLLLPGGIDDEAWPRAVELVQQEAAAEGFGDLEVVVDRPREHEVVLRGSWGSLLRVGTLANATLALHTGCHLPGRPGTPPGKQP